MVSDATLELISKKQPTVVLFWCRMKEQPQSSRKAIKMLLPFPFLVPIPVRAWMSVMNFNKTTDSKRVSEKSDVNIQRPYVKLNVT